MYLPIPRGRISHPVSLELIDLLRSLLYPLKNDDLVTEFEAKVGGHLHTDPPVFFPFARTGFYAILESLELPPGTSILMPTITIKPILDVALHFKLRPVLVDIDINTGCWEHESLERALTHQPRVALLTYLFGVVPDLETLIPMLVNANVLIVEDFSQAFGSYHDGRPLGTLGDFGICSTSSTKTFDTYGGALVFSKRDSDQKILKEYRDGLVKPKRATLIKKILKNILRNFATNRLVFGLTTFPLILAINSRSDLKVGKFTGDRSLSPLTSIPIEWFEKPCAFQAKVGLRELSGMREKDEKKVAIAKRYSQELSTIGPRGSKKGHSVYWQYISVENDPISFRNFLNSKFVDCATTSLVKLTELPDYGITQDLNGTNAIYERGVYLPCYHQLSYKEQTRVIETVRTFRNG